MNQVTITGVPSGDGESFCFDVTKEEYIRICGQEDFDLETEVHAETLKDFPGAEEMFGEKFPTRIYPDTLMRKLLGKDYHDKEVTLEIRVVKK